jgi:hypothetical protein
VLSAAAAFVLIYSRFGMSALNTKGREIRTWKKVGNRSLTPFLRFLMTQFPCRIEIDEGQQRRAHFPELRDTRYNGARNCAAPTVWIGFTLE